MADRLSASMMAALARSNTRVQQRLTATLDSASITATDISARVIDWGEIRTECYGKHPTKPGLLLFPVLTVTVHNVDGALNYGGSLVPNGIDDFESMTLNVKNELRESGSTTWVTVDNFTGRVAVPEYDATKIIRLTAEHPLAYLSVRKWNKFDRCGGNTGARALT